MNDLDLLRKYEPVVRFTAGELFFPCAIEGYLARCSLWSADSERESKQLVAPGQLTPDSLGSYRSVSLGSRLYLQYVSAPLSATEYQRWRFRSSRPILEHPDRLQRVGLVNRIIDGLFDLSLLVRGRVPGGTAAAAEQQYRQFLQDDPRRVYYGRVVRRGGYIVLHYLFFYVMNDWRSSFHGVNDHESDWEQVFIYLNDAQTDQPEAAEESRLTGATNEPTPLWVAYASHDFSGDDLRRRWDDPELEKVDGSHPVIYAGAGSHASYFRPGEYLMQVEPGFLAPLRGIGGALERFWTRTLRQSGVLNPNAALKSLFSIPFVDYARGDGLTIGPGQKEHWSPVLIDDTDDWVDGYRGLWGLDTWDPLGGERAPAGPKYQRDGSVRQSWNAVLAWAGLDKVPPPAQALSGLEELISELDHEKTELLAQIGLLRVSVRRIEIELDALRQSQYQSGLQLRRRQQLLDAEAELNAGIGRLADIEETAEAATARFLQLSVGDFGSPRAHIRHAHIPQPTISPPGKLQLFWVAVSGGLILLLVTAVIYVQPVNWLLWLVGILILFGAIEAATRNRLAIFLVRLTVALALLTLVILLLKFWWLALILALVGLVMLMVRDNLREVFGG